MELNHGLGAQVPSSIVPPPQMPMSSTSSDVVATTISNRNKVAIKYSGVSKRSNKESSTKLPMSVVITVPPPLKSFPISFLLRVSSSYLNTLYTCRYDFACNAENKTHQPLRRCFRKCPTRPAAAGAVPPAPVKPATAGIAHAGKEASTQALPSPYVLSLHCLPLWPPSLSRYPSDSQSGIKRTTAGYGMLLNPQKQTSPLWVISPSAPPSVHPHSPPPAPVRVSVCFSPACIFYDILTSLTLQDTQSLARDATAVKRNLHFAPRL